MIKFLAAIFILFSLSMLPINILAVEVSSQSMSRKIETKEVQTVSATNFSLSTSPIPSPVIKTENGNFEAKGKITAISGDNFDVEGITIIKNPQYLSSISGNIEVGKICEVKGVLENGVRYAKEIKMEGSSPTPSPSPHPTSKNTPNPTQQANSDPTVLSETKSNPTLTPSPSTNPTSPPKSVAPKPSATQEPTPTSTPQVFEKPKPTANFFFEPIIPVFSFFENLFKGWF